ncbi:type 4a pilus biogenesis protein PilO [Thermodesulfobacteriota bacterium]
MALSVKNLDRICLFIVLLSSGAAIFWILGQGVKLDMQVRKEKDLLASRQKNLSMAESSLQQLNATRAATRMEIVSLNERVPDSTDMGKFLKELDALINRRNIELITVQPMSKVKESQFVRIPVRMIFHGAFLDIYHLLYDLETMKRMLVMEKMNISKSGRDANCRVDLTANIFEH